MAYDERRIRKPLPDNILSEYIRDIAVGCYPARGNIVTVAHWFMNKQRCVVLGSEYKGTVIKKIESNATIKALRKKARGRRRKGKTRSKTFHHMSRRISYLELHNTLVRHLDSMSPEDKKALAEVLRAENPSHDDVYQLTRDALLKHVILNKKIAFDIIIENQPSNFAFPAGA